MDRLKVAVLGASGYTGSTLLRFLFAHSKVEVVSVTSRQYAGQTVASRFPRLAGHASSLLKFDLPEMETIIDKGVKVAFLALPHGKAVNYAVSLLEAGVKVIDLSADFRLRDEQCYEEFYGMKHPSGYLLKEAVYGLPEVYGAEIAGAKLVASPGCYPTSILLPLIPLVKAGLVDIKTLVINSMSGVSGAGRTPSVPLLFVECNESLRSYGGVKHRHLSEIEQELELASGEKVAITFTPHLVPVNSGICTTISASLVGEVSKVGEVLEQVYENCPFVRLLGKGNHADSKQVRDTNFIDIGWQGDERTGRLLIYSVEDNLVKGAGGQAIQSLNLMAGFKETEGLWHF